MTELAIFLTVVVSSIAQIVFFKIGYKAGQENKAVPSFNPVTIYKEHKQKKIERDEMRKEQEKLEKILQNIENYDGTDRGQIDV